MHISPLLDRFVADCQDACASGPQRVRELIERKVRDPADLLAALGLGDVPGMRTIHRADDLTILHVVWGSNMEVPAHDHRMWAVVGVYAGCEVNRIWRRAQPAAQGLRLGGDMTLHAGDAVVLEADVIHSVVNPLARTTGAIHVYGGDFFAVARSEWVSESASEVPFDVQRAVQRFSQRRK